MIGGVEHEHADVRDELQPEEAVVSLVPPYSLHTVSALQKICRFVLSDLQPEEAHDPGRPRARGEPTVRSRRHFRKRGTEYVSESGITRMSGHAKRGWGRALGGPLHRREGPGEGPVEEGHRGDRPAHLRERYSERSGP